MIRAVPGGEISTGSMPPSGRFQNIPALSEIFLPQLASIVRFRVSPGVKNAVSRLDHFDIFGRLGKEKHRVLHLLPPANRPLCPPGHSRLRQKGAVAVQHHGSGAAVRRLFIEFA